MEIEVRNLKYNSVGTIDLELNHKEFGWIPFTAQSTDNTEFGLSVWEYVKDRKDIEPYVQPKITKENLYKYLAEVRWNKEIAGTKWNDVFLPTDRESRVMITAAYTKAKENPNFNIPNWKVGPGVFVTLTNANIIEIGDTITNYVQNQFDKEAELSVLINNGTITTFEEIDEKFE